MINRVTVKQGDTLPRPRVRALDADGGALNLSEALDLSWEMTPETPGIAPDIAGAAILPVSDLSVIEYPWQAGDTDVPALYRGVFRARYRDGTKSIPTDGYVVVEVQRKAAA